jgi:Raf kinase inhibitor-like YbhB/YbcL family protein
MMNRGTGRRVLPAAPMAISLAALLVLPCTGCRHGDPESVDDPSRLTITLRSPAFADGEMIPGEFTCDGADRSPPLEWSGVPQAAGELVLICDDPDAPMGTFAHWVVLSYRPAIRGFKGGVPAEPFVPEEVMIVPEGYDNSKPRVIQGKNDFGKIGYGGPCPPSGTHRYVFRLYAVDDSMAWGGTTPTRSDVLKAIKGHILAEGRLVGRYARSK